MDELFQRLNVAEQNIAQVRNKMIRRDLQKMVRTVDTAIVAADIESVECRRLHRETIRYIELKAKVEELLVNLEKHIIFARLLGG